MKGVGDTIGHINGKHPKLPLVQSFVNGGTFTMYHVMPQILDDYKLTFKAKFE